MIEIPEDLPQKFLPLAWMIGQWRGYGTTSAKFAAAPMGGLQADGFDVRSEQNQASPDSAAVADVDPAADAMVIQEMQVSLVEQKLRVEVTTYAASTSTEIPVTATAPEGLKLLRQGQELWHEVADWDVASYRLGSEEEPQPACVADIDISESAVAGRWEARSMGPRITARVLRGQDPAIQATRMFGLVGGEIFWAQDRLVPDSVDAEGNAEAATEFSARLAKFDRATAATAATTEATATEGAATETATASGATTKPDTATTGSSAQK